MPPNPIELSLHSLIPTVAVLPTDLTRLAQSLLSQSKIKAAHLKPDEEVGRIYAVCHIAAERLRSKHGFEVGKARPPVPPRVYGKLKGFLEGVLAASSTPGRGGGGDGVGPSKKTPESKPTSMRKRWAEARKPKVATPQPADTVKPTDGSGGLEVPAYTMPMIRHLCRVCDVGKAAPHVFTGVSVVLKECCRMKPATATPSSGRKRKRGAVEDEEGMIGEDDVPGVVLAFFGAVVRRMYGAEKLKDMEHVEAATEYAMDEEHALPPAVESRAYFDDALDRFDLNAPAKGGKWLEKEWFSNVPQETSAVALDDQDQEDEDRDMQDVTVARTRPAKTPLRRKEKHGKLEDDYGLGRAGLLPGLGTMFQPAVDWLSEERMLEFERWKRDVSREVAVLEGCA